MEAAQERLESRLIQETHDRIAKSHTTTMKILESIGDSKGFADFYGLRYNKNVKAYQGRNGDDKVVYSGGDEKDHMNNILLFQKINSLVLGCITEGRPHLDKQEIPGILKEEIMKYAGI